MTQLQEMLRSLKPSGGRVVIRHKFPHRIEAVYRKALRDEVVSLAKEIASVVKPAITAELRGDVRMDAGADILRTIKTISARSLAPEILVRRMAQELRANSDAEIGKAFIKSVGVNIITPSSGLEQVVDLWVESNLTSIKDMKEAYLSKVQRAVADGFKQGLSTRDIANRINRETGASLKQAQRIARNEMGNLNAEITKQRDQDLGLDKYIWRTMRDIRVRGKPENGIGGLYPDAVPSHVAREGKTFSYSNPPSGGNPGEPFFCRCYAEAVIEF